MSGTDAELLAENRNENNLGVAIVNPTQMAEVEARMHAYFQTADGGRGNNHVVTRRRFLVQLWYFAANTGTGSRSYWEGKTFRYTDQGGTGRTAQALGAWDRIIGDPDNTGAGAGLPNSVKAYFRARTTTHITIFKATPERLTRSARMGLPETYRYLAADWFDTATGISPEEQGAIDAAKQLSLYRSARSTALNNAVQYTGAVAHTQSGNVMANARQISFRNN